MSKILTLYNIEFKRVYKLYLALLGILFAGNIAIVSRKLSDIINSVAEDRNLRPSMDILKSTTGKNKVFMEGINNIHLSTNLLVGLVVVLCLVYSIVIWYRDFLGKNRTSYTLFTLPIDKFNIYISKALTVTMMIYGIIIAQIFAWIIEVFVISGLSGVGITKAISSVIRNSMFREGLIRLYTIDFIMINIIGVVLAVVVIFTGIMIQMAFKRKGVILGSLYVVSSIIIYGYLTGQSAFTDRVLVVHSIYYIILFALSITISHKLLNKRVYM